MANKKIMKRETEQNIIATLQKMQKLIYTAATAKVFNDVKDKDIVLFVGNTRCGKSTIVNFVIGNQLTANKIRGNTYNITKLNAGSPGPEIGTGSTSETTIPTAWPSSKISGLVVDAPGFDDNRGEAQDVANSFYVKEIIKNAKSVKLALISDIKDITGDNIGHFITFIDKILTMIPHNGHLHKGMTLLFTKDRDDYIKDDIRDIFRAKVLEQLAISIKNRQLVQYLYGNMNRVVLIKMPKKAGPIQGPEVFDNLIETIENGVMNISKMEMSGVTPGISDRSRVFLLEAHRFFTESKDFDDVLRSVFQEFSKLLAEYDIPADSGTTQSTRALKNKLIALEEQVMSIRDTQSTLTEKLKQLSALVPNASQLKEDSDLYLKLKFVSFVDDVLKIKESVIFTVKINGIITHMVNRTSQVRLKLQEKMMEISQAEANARINDMIEQHRKTSDDLTRQISEMKNQNVQSMDTQRRSMGLFSMVGGLLDSIIGFF